MAPHLDLRLRRWKPSQAHTGKFGENNLNVLLAGYHLTRRKSNIAPATSGALKEKEKKHSKQSSNFITLFLVALFSPSLQSQHHFIEHYQFHYLASY